MGATNEFERDLEDQAGLKRPGRIDLRVLQNTPDAGDGNPGVQRCFRNYLHEGGMEKDLDLVGYGIKGTSVDINNAELQQVSNIGSSVITTSIWSQLNNIEATTIPAAQWVFVGEADQAVKQADSPTFTGLTINGDIIVTGTVDSVDVLALKNNFDTHKASTGEDHSYIDQSVVIGTSPVFGGLTLDADLVTTSTIDGVDVLGLKNDYDAHKTDYDSKINQSVKDTFSPTFTGLTINGNITITGNVDTVDVLGFKTSYDAHVGNVTAHIDNLTDIPSRSHTALSDKGSNTHPQIDSHISNTEKHNPFTITNDPLKSTTSTSLVKVKEMRVNVGKGSGTITFYWKLSVSFEGSGTAYSRLYKNGAAEGTEKSTTYVYPSAQSFSEAVTVSAGDLIQIYARHSTGGANAAVVQDMYFSWNVATAQDP